MRFRACKKNGVTINSALQAASLQTAALWIKRKAAGKSLFNTDLGKVTCVTNPQMHRHLPTETFEADESTLVMLMWMVINEYDLEDTASVDFWTMARRVQTAITSEKQRALDDWPMFTITQRPCFHIFEQLDGKRTGTINYTNHGESSWLNPVDGATRVVGLLPLANHLLYGSVFWWFVTTIDQRMFLAVNYVTHAVSDDVARSHLLQSKKFLLEACRRAD